MLKLQNYDTAQEFLDKAQSYLEANEVVNSLMLGVIMRVAQLPDRFPEKPFLSTVEDGNGLMLCATMTPPNGVILYSDQLDYTEALSLVANNLLENNWRVPSAIGETKLVKAFAEIWQATTGQSYKVAINERVYKLTEVHMPPLPSGEFRKAAEKDIETCAAWTEAFREEAVPNDPPADYVQMTRNRVQNGGLFVWEDQGEIITMVASNRPTKNGITVNLVYTPPKFRGKGYASANVAKLSQHLLDSGYKYCTLFTDLANPTSNSIYQKMGYEPICDFDMILFKV
jgi:uncharacterized protein